MSQRDLEQALDERNSRIPNRNLEVPPPISRGRLVFYGTLVGALAGTTLAVALSQTEHSAAAMLAVPVGAAVGGFSTFVIDGLSDISSRALPRY